MSRQTAQNAVAGDMSAWRLARGLEGKLELKALRTLEVTNYFEQIARLRIPPWAEHAHKAFCRPLREAAQFLEPDRRVDVITQYCLPGIEISGQEALHAFPEEFFPVLAVLLDAGLDRLLEVSRQRHRHFSRDLRFL